MARIISCNTNGIRAAARKGFFDWLPAQDADVVCIQETKAQEHQLGDAIFSPQGYHCFYNDAQKKGYSGTALYSRVKPRKVITSLGWDPLDSEGRYLQADFKGLSVISLYVPSGSSSEQSQERKNLFLEAFLEHLRILRRKRRSIFQRRRSALTDVIFAASYRITIAPQQHRVAILLGSMHSHTGSAFASNICSRQRLSGHITTILFL